MLPQIVGNDKIIYTIICERASLLILSLYSGCGGLDLGFEQAGFTVGLAYDIRPHSIASWNRNRPDNQVGHVADISEILLKDLDRDFGGRFVPSGVIGGPPCQSFSRANRNQCKTDVRRELVRRFFTIALRFHRNRDALSFILMENVPEIAKADDGHLLEREIRRLENNGFHVELFKLDAVSYLVPQFRKRLFLLALPKCYREFQIWSPPSGTSSRITVGDAIQEFPCPTFFHRSVKPDQIPFHPNHWCMNPKSPKFFDGSLSEGQISGRSFKTLSWNSPSATVAYGHREVHVHPNGTRRLSVFEAMKLQGFPEKYVLEGTLSAQIDQISESVPPPLAEAVANSIKRLLVNSSCMNKDQISSIPTIAASA